MRTYIIPPLVLAAAVMAAVHSPAVPLGEEDQMKKLTPVIFADEVEPCLQFWLDLGFKQTMEVPHEDRIGFAAVASGSVEVMYQSRPSIAADLPELAVGEFARSGNAFFIEVASLDDVLAGLGDVEVVVPERNTSYGAREIWVRAPCGTMVGFAEMTGE